MCERIAEVRGQIAEVKSGGWARRELRFFFCAMVSICRELRGKLGPWGRMPRVDPVRLVG